MKRYLSITAAAIMLTGLFAFAGIKRYLDIWQQLSISQQDANGSIFGNFQTGDLSFPYSTVIKGLAPAKRAAAVREMGDYIRKYTSSQEFAAQYLSQREAAKPAAPAEGEEKIRIRLAGIRHDLEENEKGMAQAKGDMKKLYEATISMLKTEQKALQDPNDPQHEMYVSGLTGGTGSMDPEQYRQAKADFEKEYPTTVNELIKKRLKAFLELTKDIDFNARLIQVGGRRKFADARLEAKEGHWKRCFRCGEETITAARAYASQWLKELR